MVSLLSFLLFGPESSSSLNKFETAVDDDSDLRSFLRWFDQLDPDLCNACVMHFMLWISVQ